MAAWTTTVDTGTSTETTTWTSSGTTTTAGIQIYQGSVDQIRITKGHKHNAVKRDVHVKKGFWDGVEWKEYTSYIPRKSITGKIIIGKMHKRWRTPEPRMRGQGLGIFTQYAKTKELFEEKLRGKA